MSRIALLLCVLSSTALAEPIRPPPADAAQLPSAATPPPAAQPPAPAAPDESIPYYKRKCRSNLYLEPTLLIGATRTDSVARLHAAAGFRYSHCPSDAPEGFRIHLGLFVQVGSEVIGDAFTKGIEAEYNRPFRNGRIGARAYYGTSNHSLFIVGGGVRYRQGPAHVGFEMIYSSRSTEGQAAAVGGLAAFGVSGKAGAVVAGVIGVLALVALSQFSTT